MSYDDFFDDADSLLLADDRLRVDPHKPSSQQRRTSTKKYNGDSSQPANPEVTDDRRPSPQTGDRNEAVRRTITIPRQTAAHQPDGEAATQGDPSDDEDDEYHVNEQEFERSAASTWTNYSKEEFEDEEEGRSTVTVKSKPVRTVAGAAKKPPASRATVPASRARPTGQRKVPTKNRASKASSSDSKSTPKQTEAMKRIMSGKRHKVQELNSLMALRVKELVDVRRENKTLRKMHRIQERELNEFSTERTEVPRAMAQNDGTIKTAKQDLAASKQKHEKTWKLLLGREDELRQAERKLALLERIGEDRSLDALAELERSLEQVQNQRERHDEQIAELEAEIAEVEKEAKRNGHEKAVKAKHVNSELSAIEKENRELSLKFKEKEKELSIRNIYSRKPPHFVSGSVSSSPVLAIKHAEEAASPHTTAGSAPDDRKRRSRRTVSRPPPAPPKQRAQPTANNTPRRPAPDKTGGGDSRAVTEAARKAKEDAELLEAERLRLLEERRRGEEELAARQRDLEEANRAAELETKQRRQQLDEEARQLQRERAELEAEKRRRVEEEARLRAAAAQQTKLLEEAEAARALQEEAANNQRQFISENVQTNGHVPERLEFSDSGSKRDSVSTDTESSVKVPSSNLSFSDSPPPLMDSSSARDTARVSQPDPKPPTVPSNGGSSKRRVAPREPRRESTNSLTRAMRKDYKFAPPVEQLHKGKPVRESKPLSDVRGSGGVAPGRQRGGIRDRGAALIGAASPDDDLEEIIL